MKIYLAFLVILVVAGVVLFNFLGKNNDNQIQDRTIDVEKMEEKREPSEKQQANMPNPASKYCEENGGVLEIVTDNEGSQFGLCKFENYSCEEWAYYRNECDVEEDAIKIRDALTAKGLDLTGMKVVIHEHLGRDIAGGVVPVDFPGGGGYVFATKDDSGNIKIVADGNGAIMCEMLEDYPGYSSYLIPECIDESGTPIIR